MSFKGNHSHSGFGTFDNPAGGVGALLAPGDSRGGSKANFSNTDNNLGQEGSQYSDVAFTEEDSLQIIREAEIKKILSSPLLLKRFSIHFIIRMTLMWETKVAVGGASCAAKCKSPSSVRLQRLT